MRFGEGGVTMPYVAVPKDLFSVKTKFMFNLTKRQVICFSIGGGIGLLLHFTLKKYGLEGSIVTMSMMATMSPFFILAMYEKNGKPLEVILEYMVRQKYLVSNKRPYQNKNIYVLVEEEYRIDREVTKIVKKNQVKQRGKTTSKKVSGKEKQKQKDVV